MDGVLLELLCSQNISPVVKKNINKTLLKTDLTGETINKIVQMIFKNSDLYFLYLPIITKNFDKISNERQEILSLCYFNILRKQQFEDPARLDKISRVDLTNFFTKAILTIGRLRFHQSSNQKTFFY